MKQTLSILFIFLLACGPTGPQYLRSAEGNGIKCDVEEGVTTKAEFHKICGRAKIEARSKGCKEYLTDKYEHVYYCFEDGVLSEVLDMRGWISKD